jgi:large subunit ribosomal protein L32
MVVRMRHTKSHTGNRRSHHALESTSFAKCSNCQALKRRHTVCSNCGFYRTKKVLDLVKKIEKKQKKAKAKKIESK